MTIDEPTLAIVSPASVLVSGLRAARYRFTLDCLSGIRLKRFPGITLYGALKSVMRPVTCRKQPFCRDRCAQPTRCVYGKLLQTVAPRKTGGQTGYEDAPRPFVLHFPDLVRSGYRRGERLRFDVVLLGEATLYLEDVVKALRGLERSGLGDERQANQGRVRLATVDVVEPEGTKRLLDGLGQTLHPEPLSRPIECLASPLPVASATRVKLRFETPLRLMQNRRWIGTEAFELPHLVRALTRRIETLARFHGMHPPEFDPDALVEASRTVRIEERALRWEPLERHSASQRQTHPMDGLLGHVVVEGNLAPLLPLLAAGRLLHAGSKTTMGLGQYALQPFELP
ncbi:MAG: CRISPR system precrRNA processing endoribonuclease RAMP protein Cas6 [Rhodothermales bacterium]